MDRFINTLFNGVSLSSIILLTSLGLAITFGLMRVINMAHGEFVMIGAYTTYVVQQIFVKYCPESIRDIYYFIAIPAAFAVTFILGSLLERFIISRLYGREIDSLLATWGISLILQQAARSIFGTQGVNVTAPSFLNGGIKIGGCTFSYNRLFIILLVALCLLLVWFIMYRSNFGKQMRAVMQNRSMIELRLTPFRSSSRFYRLNSRSELYRKQLYGSSPRRRRQAPRHSYRLCNNRLGKHFHRELYFINYRKSYRSAHSYNLSSEASAGTFRYQEQKS